MALVLNSQVNGLGVIRSLGMKGVSVLALDPDPLAVGMHSKYVKGRVVCPEPLHQEEAFVNLLISIGKEMEVPGILFPTTDAYVVAVVRSKAKLEKYYRIPFSPWEIIKEIVDKEHQYKKAKKAGIPIPITFFPKGINDVRTIGKNITYPVILKPAYSHPFVVKYPIKAVKVNSDKELLEKYQKYTLAGHKMLIQEIIEGNANRLHAFCSYVNKHGEFIAIFTSRKLEQYPPDFGMGTVFESVDEPRIVELGTRLLKIFNYYGISSSEFKLDPKDGQFKLMELNPRTTRCSSLSTECGVNFPYIAYQDMLGKKSTRASLSYNTRWVFVEQRLFKQGKIAFIGQKMKPPLRHRKCIYAIFSSNDPIPELVYLYAILYRRIKKGLKRAQEELSRTGSIYLWYAKCRCYIKTKGFLAFLGRIFIHIIEIFVKYRKAIIFEKDLSDKPMPASLRRDITIKIATIDDVDELQRLTQPDSPKIILDRFSKDEICFVAKIGSQIVHQNWVSFNYDFIHILDKKFSLREGEAYVYGAYTSSKFRGRNIYPTVVNKVIRYLREKGYKKLYFLVDLKIHPSVKAYKRIFGTERGKVISYTRVLVFRIYRCRTMEEEI